MKFVVIDIDDPNDIKNLSKHDIIGECIMDP